MQLKDVGGECEFNQEDLDCISDQEFKETYLLNQGDVVFRSRGPLLKAIVIPAVQEKIVISAPLMKIQVDSTQILPEFLCWAINSSIGQSYFQSQAEGSSIKMISKATLEQMDLQVPSLEEQQKILDLIALQKREAVINRDILQRREKIIHASIMKHLSRLKTL